MKIIKKVIGIGNGAAVYVPKEYSGREITIILPEGIDEIRKRILSQLIEFMPNIIGAYIYGSYARDEQTNGSDVDLLIIVKEEDGRIKELFKDIDVRVITLEGLERAVKNMPAIIMPILREAKVLLNPILLEDFKNRKIDFKKFRWHFEDIKRVLGIINSFIELDDDEDTSITNVYSLIMRIRVCYMIESLIKNRIFSNGGVKKLLLDYGLSEREFEKFYFMYQKVRGDEKFDDKIKKKEILKLIGIVEKYSKRVENESKKASKKGN